MSRLNLTPWARMALAPDERAGLEARAEALDAHVFVTGRNVGGPWTVHATNRSIQESAYHVAGPLAVAISVTLDRFRAQQEIVAEELEDLGFTGEELVQIASQSGIEVNRG
jgi:hypothetical protein